MDLDDTQMPTFEGLMLSDGHLRRQSPAAQASMSFALKYDLFADAIRAHLPSLDWAPAHPLEIYDKRTDKRYHSVQLRSHVCEFLTEQHNRWYPRGTKIVPKDVVIKPITLLWWYLGDGCLGRKKARPNFRRIVLSTDSFTTADTNFLIRELKSLVGRNVYPEMGRIIISRDSITRFASILPNNPVECYEYKFEFGQYLNSDYRAKNYAQRPLRYINDFRKANKVRELTFVNKDLILKKEVDYVR